MNEDEDYTKYQFTIINRNSVRQSDYAPTILVAKQTGYMAKCISTYAAEHLHNACVCYDVVEAVAYKLDMSIGETLILIGETLPELLEKYKDDLH